MLIASMEAPASEIENAFTWQRIAITNLWMPYTVVSQPIEDASLQRPGFGLKKKVVHAIKTFLIKSYQ